MTRTGLVRSFMLVSLLLTVGAPLQALSQSDALSSFIGRWVWIGHRDKHGLDQACKNYWEQYEISSDGRDITNRYVRDGRTTEGRGYRVLYSEANTAVMYLNNEDRRLRNGDRIIWVLIMNTPDHFSWRIYGQPWDPADDPKYDRVRCR